MAAKLNYYRNIVKDENRNYYQARVYPSGKMGGNEMYLLGERGKHLFV